MLVYDFFLYKWFPLCEGGPPLRHGSLHPFPFRGEDVDVAFAPKPCGWCIDVLCALVEKGSPPTESAVGYHQLAAMGHEKHVPVYEVVDNIVNVKVGEVDHPMLEAHYIQWIALQTNLGNQRKVLQPGQEPKAQFALLPGEQVIAVYEYCNLHGLYKA